MLKIIYTSLLFNSLLEFLKGRELECDWYVYVRTSSLMCIYSLTLMQYMNSRCFIFSQDYKSLFEGAGTNSGEKTLEDKFFEHEVYTCICMSCYQTINL